MSECRDGEPCRDSSLADTKVARGKGAGLARTMENSSNEPYGKHGWNHQQH